MLSTSDTYFFDYPLVDASALAASAIRLLYHGSAQGAFGSYGSNNARKKPIDLHEVEAFKISLTHLSGDSLDESFEYNLVYFNQELSQNFWDGKKRSLARGIKKLTRRVHLNNKPSLNAKRYKTPFWIKFEKPIYVTRFDTMLAEDHYVPVGYRYQFQNKFQGFLMRTATDYPVVRNIFEAYGLKLEDRRDVSDPLDGSLQVHTYRT